MLPPVALPVCLGGWQGAVACSWGWDLLQEIQAWLWAVGEGCPNFRSPFLMLTNPSSGMTGGGTDTKVQSYCCTGACLQALYPSVLPASQSCLQLCSQMKLDHDWPWLPLKRLCSLVKRAGLAREITAWSLLLCQPVVGAGAVMGMM